MLTFECIRVVNKHGGSVLLCQAPPATSDLSPGLYYLQCQSDDSTLHGKKFRFQWTGTEWKRRKVTKRNDPELNLSAIKNIFDMNSQNSPVKRSLTVPKSGRYSLSSCASSSESVSEDNFSDPQGMRNRLEFSRSSSESSAGRREKLAMELSILTEREYSPGDKLTFDLDLKQVRSVIERVRVGIVQRATRIEDGEEKTVERILVEEVRKVTGVQGSFCVTSELQIPKDLESGLEWGRDGAPIGVSYFLTFQAEIASGKRGLSGESPIKIKNRMKTVDSTVQNNEGRNYV